MGFTATHQYWDAWLIGDSRVWTAGLLALLGVAMFGLAARHIGMTLLVAWLRSALLRGVCLLDCLADGAVAARGDHHPRLGAGRSP
jgi:hypothetical protein